MIDNTALLNARIKMLRMKKGVAKDISNQNKQKNDNDEAFSSSFSFYNSQANEILQSITELRDLVLDKRKEYIMCSATFSMYDTQSSMTESNRKQFDCDSDIAVKQCSKLIEYFETQISTDKRLRKEDQLLHLRFVGKLLNVYLKDVCRLILQLRTIYKKKMDYMRKIRRLANLVDMYEASIASKNEEFLQKFLKADDVKNTEKLEPPDKKQPMVEDFTDFSGEITEISSVPFEEASEEEFIQPSKAEQRQLLVENQSLYQKLSHNDEDIMHIGKQLSEIESLQTTFAEKVIQQEHDIEVIHTQTIYTLDNLEAANQFIRESIRNSASRRVIILFCLIVLTFTLLFLDWYNP